MRVAIRSALLNADTRTAHRSGRRSATAEVGEFCATYLDYKLRKLPCVRVEADEAWGCCGAKEENETKEGQGD
jgi:hypothetical protein